MADGGEAADRSAVARGPTRPPPDAGGAAVLLAPVPPALAPPRGPGARVREGAGASPAVEARPRARAAGRPADPRRGPHPLPPGSGAAARRLRGCRGPGGHAAGGGGRPPGRRPRRGRVPPGAQDGTARRLVQAPRPRLWRRETSGGRGPAVALACGAAVGTGAGRAGVPTPPRRQADAAEATTGPGADAGGGSRLATGGSSAGAGSQTGSVWGRTAAAMS